MRVRETTLASTFPGNSTNIGSQNRSELCESRRIVLGDPLKTMLTSVKPTKPRLGRIFLVGAVLMLPFGCGGGQVGRAIEGVQELRPEADKRNKEIEELAAPSSGTPNE